MENDPMYLNNNPFSLLGDEALPLEDRAEYGPLILNQLKKLIEVLTDAKQRIQDVQTDRGLNAVGKSERFAKIKDAATSAVNTIGTNLRRKLDQDLQNARDTLTGTAGLKSPTELSDFVLAIEVRNECRRLDPLELDGVLTSFAAAGNRRVIQAVLDDPFGHIVRPDRRDALIRKFQEATHPDLVGKVQCVERVLSIFDSNISSALKAVITM